MATTNTSKVPIGTVLEGKFRITREIGRGGMAAVYEAENIDIGKRVAVKILAAELITSRVVRERFIREARAAASIRSPYICDVYDSGMYEERPFLVMELLEGESLYDMMTRLRQLDSQTTLRVATHTARGLAKAHESNIVHRDLKPENIFLTQDEEGHLLAKIVDFGLAKFYESGGPDAQSVRLTREGALFGTPAYMSPEQAKGQGEVDHRADLWALGCIVYECLTGQTVWSVEQGVAMILAQIANSPLPKPSKLRPDLPPTFERWFERALNRDESKRFQTAKEFAESLNEALFPKEGGTRPLNSEVDSAEVDHLLAAAERDARSAADPSAARAELGSGHEPSNPPPGAREPMVMSTEPPPVRSSSLRAVSLLMVLAAVALGAYATWLYLLHPPGKPAARPTQASVPHVVAAPKPKKAPKPEPVMADVESESYARKISEAQELLRSEPVRAVEAFRLAFQDGAKPAARSLLSHASVAVEEAGKCKVTGVSRPRPFQLDVPVSRPSIAFTSKGTIFSWVDNHQDARRRQAFTVLLDASLRRISTPITVTPEAQNVRQYQILQVGDRLALIYWDDGGKEPGVYARMLDAEGKIETSLRKLSSTRKGDYYPAIAASPAGDVWAVWEEEFEGGSSDVVARHLGADLEPLADIVRLTALRPPAGAARQPRTAAVFVDKTQVSLVFARDLGGQRVQMMLQSIPLSDPHLTSGVVRKMGKNTGPIKTDEVVGTLRALTSPGNHNTPPRLTCTEEGCFAVWDEEKAGGFMAFVDRERGPLWHRTFASKGAGPALSSDDRGVVVAWFEGARLKLAPLTRDGVGLASVISRVSGIQPAPDIVRGAKSGEWYVAFRDYEAAHLEVFAARAECP